MSTYKSAAAVSKLITKVLIINKCIAFIAANCLLII